MRVPVSWLVGQCREAGRVWQAIIPPPLRRVWLGWLGVLAGGIVIGVAANHVDAIVTGQVVPWLSARDPRSYPHILEVAVAVAVLVCLLWAYGQQKLAGYAELERTRAERERGEAEQKREAAEFERNTAALEREYQSRHYATLEAQHKSLATELHRLQEEVDVAGLNRLRAYDEALATQIRWLGALQDIRDVLDSSQSEEDRFLGMQRFVAYVLYDVFSLIGPSIVRQGSIALPCQGEPYLAIVFGVGVDDHTKRVRRFCTRGDVPATDRGDAGEAFLTGKPVIDPDIRRSATYQPRKDRPIDLTPYEAILAHPISIGDRKLGVLCLNGMSAGAFNEEFHIRVAGLAAAILAQALLYSESLSAPWDAGAAARTGSMG